MHTLRDLGLYHEAAKHADAALDLPAENVRTKALHGTLLATVQAGRGDLDAACDTAGRALAMAPDLTSARVNERLRDFASRVSQYRDRALVRDYLERSAAMLPQS